MEIKINIKISVKSESKSNPNRIRIQIKVLGNPKQKSLDKAQGNPTEILKIQEILGDPRSLGKAQQGSLAPLALGRGSPLGSAPLWRPGGSGATSRRRSELRRSLGTAKEVLGSIGSPRIYPRNSFRILRILDQDLLLDFAIIYKDFDLILISILILIWLDFDQILI